MTVLRLTQKLALVKPGYLLENLSIPHYSSKGSDNVLGADNQQERPESRSKPQDFFGVLLGRLVLYSTLFLTISLIAGLFLFFWLAGDK